MRPHAEPNVPPPVLSGYRAFFSSAGGGRASQMFDHTDDTQLGSCGERCSPSDRYSMGRTFCWGVFSWAQSTMFMFFTSRNIRCIWAICGIVNPVSLAAKMHLGQVIGTICHLGDSLPLTGKGLLQVRQKACASSSQEISGSSFTALL